MIAARRTAIALLAIAGVCLAAAAVLWAASLAGLARPLAVDGASLRPSLSGGDLVVVTRAPVDGLAAGDVVGLPAAVAGGIALERVEAVERTGEQEWTITTAAAGPGGSQPRDAVVGDEVWAPSLRLPGVGGIAEAVVAPGLGVPLLAAAMVLVAVVLLAPPTTARRRSVG